MNKFLLFLIFLPNFFWGQISPSASVDISIQSTLCTSNDCTELEANYFETKSTNHYTVNSIDYAPFPYYGGTIINSGDDIWSSEINLPFQFSFFENCYNSLLIGSNGLITFDLTTFSPNAVCVYTYNQTIPNSNFPIKNSIYGVYQDLNPNYATAGQNINYYTYGISPNRVFVLNFNNLPQYYNQVVDFQTSQIILYETTNIIDINIQKRTPNNGWNNGNGVIGIQNQSGTNAYSPPGRNTGNWSSTNESWQFKPNGTVTSQLVWKKNGIEIGTQNPINVCYDQPNDVYQAIVSFNSCASSLSEDSITLEVISQDVINEPLDIIICSNNQNETLNIDQSVTILDNVNTNNYGISYYLNSSDAANGNPSSLIQDPLNFLSFTYPITIFCRTENVETGCFYVNSFQVNIIPLLPLPIANPNQTFTQGQTLENLLVIGTNIQWYDSEVGGNNLPLNTLLVNNTTYYCTQSNEYGCENGRNINATRLAITVQESLKNNDFYFQNLKIQPNPVTDVFTVSNQKNIVLVEVFSSRGQLIISTKVNDYQVKLDLSNFNSGVYFVKVYSENQEKTIKIVKN